MEIENLGGVPDAVREYINAMASGDVSRLQQWLAPAVDHVRIGDDGDPKTEKAIVSGLGTDGVKAVIEGVHEMLRDVSIEVYETKQYEGEAGVWSVRFMLSGVSRVSIPQGFQAGQAVRLPGLIMAKIENGVITGLRENM